MRSLHPLSRTLFVSEKPRVQGSSRNLERSLQEAFFVRSVATVFWERYERHFLGAKQSRGLYTSDPETNAKISFLHPLVNGSSTCCSPATRKAGFVAFAAGGFIFPRRRLQRRKNRSSYLALTNRSRCFGKNAPLMTPKIISKPAKRVSWLLQPVDSSTGTGLSMIMISFTSGSWQRLSVVKGFTFFNQCFSSVCICIYLWFKVLSL